MKRREALKNIGLGAGIMVVGPTTLSLLQSCKNESEYEWQPVFLSAANGFVLKKVLDIILPATDTPGAGDLNIAQFLDSYMAEVAPPERQEEFRESADAFAEAFKNEFDKDPGEASEEEFEKIVEKYLRATPAEKEKYMKRNSETQDPQDKDPVQEPKEENTSNPDVGAYAYLQDVREMGVWAWKTSEQIGENVLWYDPIPGQYIPCGPVEELGNGNAMAL
ncbi:gluconate 2-dehydrogenase subunit 3 family protein [Autumnicola musiva]|uniref:Gluconate 2-dehydrogenase subunit 3 family protein n=1 Tax=Autumnicola musiva TaxID=3075589 RepID=A0ABU3D422_9FLAO|nr:gluconate 2-dehydrogenase subunit 3 family protein [Zunongwangia sp. F117]MDT0676254.1 gluconate 2-dehydrogenase subunit 3 family protein [Zunongwangia sp. F117]